MKIEDVDISQSAKMEAILTMQKNIASMIDQVLLTVQLSHDKEPPTLPVLSVTSPPAQSSAHLLVSKFHLATFKTMPACLS